MNQEEASQEEINNIKEIKSNLTIGNGFTFGFGFGIGFFISGIAITVMMGFILFNLFGPTISSFQKSITDPFGFKSVLK